MAYRQMYDNAMQVYRRALGKKVEKGVWLYGKLSQFTGFIDTAEFTKAGAYGASAATLAKPSGKVVDIRRDFETFGSLEMDVPIRYPLTGQGVIGNQTLIGNEEKRKILTKKVSLNQVRTGVLIQDSKLSKQDLKKPELYMALMEKGTADCQDWFTRRFSYNMYQALLQGYPDFLTDSTNGPGKTAKSHPNLYVKTGTNAPVRPVNAGATVVPVAEGGTGLFDATYETNVAAALTALRASGSVTANAFTAADIRRIAYLAGKHKLIAPLGGTGAGTQMKTPLLILHESQMQQLRADSEWQNAMRLAGPRDETNQLFNGVSEGTYFEGLFIMVDSTIPGALVSGDATYSSAYGTVNYGSQTYMLTPRDASPLKPAICLGAGAITGGYSSPISFESEDYDYKQKIADGADCIIGFERADITDDEGVFGGAKGSLYENASSLVYFTYSPDTVA